MGYAAWRIATILRDEGGIPALLRKCARLPLNVILGMFYAVRMRSLVADSDLQALVDRVYTGFGGLMRPLQVRSELAAFIALVADRRPSAILEIGTATGGTFFLLARAAREDACLISIDLPCGSFGGGYPGWRAPLYRSFALHNQKIALIRADSHSADTFSRVTEVLGTSPLEVLYIDGDHTYAGVKKDFEMYAPLVQKGGLIIFHDIARNPPEPGCDVFTFWEEVKKRYAHREIVEDKDQVGKGIGVLFVD